MNLCNSKEKENKMSEQLNEKVEIMCYNCKFEITSLGILY
jgi:hypothetical protein